MSTRCASCGELLLPSFTECWKCGALRLKEGEPPPEIDEAPPEMVAAAPAGAARQARAEAIPPREELAPPREPYLWAEVLVVLIVSVFPWIVNAVWAFVFDLNPSTVPKFCVFTTVMSLQAIAISLHVIARSRRPPSFYGLVRPEVRLDAFLGFVLFAMAFGATRLVFPPLHRIFPGGNAVHEPAADARDHLFLSLTVALSSFSQELLLRGYLLPRLEDLLRSTTASVFWGSALFAAYHLNQGLAATLTFLLWGIIFAAAFAATRRLWPLVLAHCLWGIWAAW
jgi:membrane protease YdiL (CAAX protease family)